MNLTTEYQPVNPHTYDSLNYETTFTEEEFQLNNIDDVRNIFINTLQIDDYTRFMFLVMLDQLKVINTGETMFQTGNISNILDKAVFNKPKKIRITYKKFLSN